MNDDVNVFQKHALDLAAIGTTSMLLLAAGAAALLFDWLQAPLGWLLGPLVLGMVYTISQASPQAMSPIFSIIGQAILGVSVATQFSWDSVSMMSAYAFPLLICITITSSVSILKGYLLCQLAGLDWSTGLLASIPCIIPSLITLSEEVGANSLTVAVLQYLRSLLIIVVVPIGMSLFIPSASLDSQTQATVTNLLETSMPISMTLNLFIIAVCGSLGVWLGSLIRFPASIFFGPLFVGLVACWAVPHNIQIPIGIFNSALVFIGLGTGLQFNLQGLRPLMKAVLIEVVLALVLVLLCSIAGYEFHMMTNIDPVTAILGSMPTGTQAMIAATVKFGGDTSLVVSMHMTRMFIILTLRSLLITPLIRQEQPVTASTDTSS